jgi:hypothetical protein
MNVFIIHSGEDLEEIHQKKKELCDKCPKAKVLLLEYRQMFWKREALRLMKSAQMILYIVGEKSYKSRNIDWELKQALRLHKGIVCYKMEPDYKLNRILLSKDPFSQEQVLLAEIVSSIDDVNQIITNYENNQYINIFNGSQTDDFEETSLNELFEQYRMFTETSEALVNRRQNVNSFYITANTALITIAATAFSLNGDIFSKLIITIVLTIPGILLNLSWRKVLESYGIINSSKLKIIGLIEKRLAVSLYDAEWQAMSNKYNKKQYVSFTDGEKNIPIIFNGVYILVDVICILCVIYIVF